MSLSCYDFDSNMDESDNESEIFTSNIIEQCLRDEPGNSTPIPSNSCNNSTSSLSIISTPDSSRYIWTPSKTRKKCRLCDKCYSGKTSTSNLKYHYSTCHSNILTSKKNILKGIFSKDDNDEINKLITEFFIEEGISFRLIENKKFRSIFQRINDSIKIISRPTLMSNIKCLYEDKLPIIQTILNQNDHVSLTLDLWSSVASIPYMGVTAHIINEQFELKSFVLEITNIPFPHTGNHIGRKLLSIMNNFNISKKVLSITTDNASNMITAMNAINIAQPGQIYHIRCLGHVINLLVKTGIKELGEDLKKVSRWVRKLHTSPKLMQRFREVAEVNIPLDVITRWNSTFKMLSVFNKHIHIINTLGIKDGCSSDSPLCSAEEVKFLEGVESFLMVFDVMTNSLSSQSHPTIGLCAYYLSKMRKHLNRTMIYESNSRIIKAAKSMLLKIDEYDSLFQTFNFYAGVFLDPRLKAEKMPDTCCTLEHKEEFERLLTSSIIDRDEQEGVQFLSSTSLAFQLLEDDPQLEDQEIKGYLNQPLLDAEQNILKWWALNQPRYPRLAKLAKKFLTQQGTSVPAERLFSAAVNLVTKKRNQISSLSVNHVLCLRDWANL